MTEAFSARTGYSVSVLPSREINYFVSFPRPPSPRSYILISNKASTTGEGCRFLLSPEVDDPNDEEELKFKKASYVPFRGLWLLIKNVGLLILSKMGQGGECPGEAPFLSGTDRSGSRTVSGYQLLHSNGKEGGGAAMESDSGPICGQRVSHLRGEKALGQQRTPRNITLYRCYMLPASYMGRRRGRGGREEERTDGIFVV